MPGPSIPLKRWKRVEYERLVEQGVFEPGDRVELIDGLLLVAEPQSSPHYTAIQLVERALSRAFGEEWTVRTQAPIALDDASEPEPDVAVVARDPDAYRDAHPSQPVLIVEISESSYRIDRDHKASLYARARVRDYWIVDVVGGSVEIHREPAESSEAPYGWQYRSVTILRPPATVAPLVAPPSTIAVAALLP